MKDIIKKALQDSGMQQKELAERIGVSNQAVSQWINGEKQPSFDNIKLMTEVFGIKFGESLIKKGIRSESKMKKQTMELKDLDSIDKAQIEARSILQTSGIQNYSQATYILVNWLTVAVIGLVYHQYLHKKENDEVYYEDIFYYLNDIVDENGNSIEEAFFLMGGDLFESFGDCKMANHDYAHDCMDLWYRFKKVYNRNSDSDFDREFKTAMLDMISKNSCY